MANVLCCAENLLDPFVGKHSKRINGGIRRLHPSFPIENVWLATDGATAQFHLRLSLQQPILFRVAFGGCVWVQENFFHITANFHGLAWVRLRVSRICGTFHRLPSSITTVLLVSHM